MYTKRSLCLFTYISLLANTANTLKPADLIILISAGRRSPDFTSTISPTTSFSTATVSFFDSRRTTVSCKRGSYPVTVNITPLGHATVLWFSNLKPTEKQRKPFSPGRLEGSWGGWWVFFFALAQAPDLSSGFLNSTGSGLHLLIASTLSHTPMCTPVGHTWGTSLAKLFMMLALLASCHWLGGYQINMLKVST